MTTIQTTLAQIHPMAFYAIIAVAVGALVWLWRRVAPRSFEALPASLQGLPAMLLGAVSGALSSGQLAAAFGSGDWTAIGRVLVEAVLGAAAGVAAIGGHHVLKGAPGPYLGGSWPAAGQAKPMSLARKRTRTMKEGSE